MTLRKMLIVAAVFGTSCLHAQQLPLDPLVRIGKLANGFTYYIRHNEQPKKHVELYLVSKAGSILEDDDQRGLAHFMEHMNFNGTKHYPKNELVDYLQKAGVRFGADLNANTSFDETVYQLPIPTDDPAMFAHGLDIMRDWAQEATLDPAEIEKERGVILEEERLGKGAKDRITRQTLPLLLNHARYAERLPIGRDEILTRFKPDVIKRFHHDWYRPDLQALVIVGDIDVNEAEKLAKAKFSDLKNPIDEKPRIRYTIPLTGKSQFIAVTDKEKTTSSIEVVYKHTAPQLKTEGDYLKLISRSLFNQLAFARKQGQLSRQVAPAFTSLTMGIGGLLGNVDAFDFEVSAKQGRLRDAFEQTWRVLEGIRRYGFTQEELDRAKQNYLRSLQDAVNEQGKTPSANYVQEYQRLFLNGEATPGTAWEYQFAKTHLPNISLADVKGVMDDYLGSRDIDILITAPEKAKDALPNEAMVNGWIDTIAREEIKPYQEVDVTSKSLLTVLPVPGKVIKREDVPQIGLTRLTLSNGVKVLLKPTYFKNDQIVYGAFCPGGTSLYDAADYDMAVNAAGLVSRMGFGDFTTAELDQVLAGKIIHSAVSIGQRAQNINASTTPQDIDYALRLTYLQFTAPRKDTLVFNNAISETLASLADRYNDPINVFKDTVSYVMSNYNYRSAPFTQARAIDMTLDRTWEIYRERFADASGFTFVFVGNFREASLIPLLERYLGSLPSVHQQAEPRDIGQHIPEGKLVKKVFKGTENKAIVQVVYSGSYHHSALANLKLRALNDILQIKVLQRLREKESQVYSPQLQSVYSKYPRNRFAVIVQFGCAPQNVDHLVASLDDEMRKLREQGPQADDIAKFKAQYQKGIEEGLKENSFWESYLLTQDENQDDVLMVQDISSNLKKIDAASLRQAAQLFLSGQNQIIFELLPEYMQ